MIALKYVVPKRDQIREGAFALNPLVTAFFLAQIQIQHVKPANGLVCDLVPHAVGFNHFPI